MSTVELKRKEAPSSDALPLTFRVTEQESLGLKMYLLDLIAERKDPFLSHRDAIRALLEEHYRKPLDQLVKEFQEKQKG